MKLKHIFIILLNMFIQILHILINFLPLPLWLGYCIFIVGTNRDLFVQLGEHGFMWLVAIVFVVYNCYSTKIYEAVIRNSVFVLSYAYAFRIWGQIYLEHFPHMSDDHETVPIVAREFAIYAIVVALIGCLVKCIITLVKRKRERADAQNI